MNALFRGAVAVGQIDPELAMKEIDSLVKWHADRKKWHHDKTRQKMAAEGSGTAADSEMPGSATFRGSDFGLDEVSQDSFCFVYHAQFLLLVSLRRGDIKQRKE